MEQAVLLESKEDTASPKQLPPRNFEEAGRQVHSYFDRMWFACRLARSMNGGGGGNVHWVQVSKCPTLTHLISRSMNSALSGSLDCRAFLLLPVAARLSQHV